MLGRIRSAVFNALPTGLRLRLGLALLGEPHIPPDAGAPLTADDLAKLAASPLIDIGGLFESHRDLSRVPAPRASEEFTLDRGTPREIADQPVGRFAPPYGRRGPDTGEHLRSAGDVTATTIRSGVSGPLDDPCRRPRIRTPDIGGDEFERLIS